MSQQLKEYLEKNCELHPDGYYLTSQSHIKPIKNELIKIQNGICPILKKHIELDSPSVVVDHKHKLKNDTPTLDNKLGFIRGALEFRCNAFEGKVWNFYKRLGLDKDIGFSELLRNLADFHDSDLCPLPILHYKEKVKMPKMSKADYNKIKKYWKFIHPNKKLPKCPRNITKEFTQYKKETDEYIEKLNSGQIKTINKIEFNRILKYYPILYPRRKKLPIFPEHGIMDNILEELLNNVNKLHFKNK
ncbi:MAG: endonuclease domain-containing protein [Sphaerochaeta sp.]